MSEVAPLQPGDPERLGDYPLGGRLGEGGQGVVYLGHDPGGEKVAVKLLRTRLDRDGKAHARFAREVAIAERVAPFCTARMITADLAGETPYVVSEYIDGPSLQDSVQANGPMAGAGLDRLAVSTATALAAIHEAGIVHRDFKPGNVLLASDGPRVIDFGIARALDATSTFTSQIIGTPAFMSPEQINGEEIGPPSDMFAWGSTIVYAATGASPFGGDTFPAILNRIVNREPDLGALTGPLRHIVAATLSKDPAQRPTPRQVLDHMVRGGTAPVTVRQQPATPTPAAPPPGQVAVAGHARVNGPVWAPARPAAEPGLFGAVLGGFVALYLLTAMTGPWGGNLQYELNLTRYETLLVTLTYLVAAALTARVGTVLGRRHPNAVAATATSLLLTGSALSTYPGFYPPLLAGRFLSGLGAGALVPVAVLLTLRPGPRRTSTIQLMVGLGVLALALGNVLDWWLMTMFIWRFAFFVALPPLLIALLASITSGLVVTRRRANH